MYIQYHHNEIYMNLNNQIVIYLYIFYIILLSRFGNGIIILFILLLCFMLLIFMSTMVMKYLNEMILYGIIIFIIFFIMPVYQFDQLI